MLKRRFLITGGAGFIGSALIRFLISETEHQVLNFDKLTYAGSLESLQSISDSSRYEFVYGDISDYSLVTKTVKSFQPNVIMNLAAESHVDRSITGPKEFINTNIVGTSVLLEATREYWTTLAPNLKEIFRFQHVSTDEVFGSLGSTGYFTEETAYDPSSPYSASKASSDHLVRAWHRTYGLPILITNCSNNYGPYQYPEKLIPLMLQRAIKGKSLPVYGNGQQIRDWLYVEDHVRALYKVATHGLIGETYNIGGNNERTNIEVVQDICNILEEVLPSNLQPYKDLITFVEDRPGHDYRYAIDATKIQSLLGWMPNKTFESGLKETILWYLDNTDWFNKVIHKQYQDSHT